MHIYIYNFYKRKIFVKEMSNYKNICTQYYIINTSPVHQTSNFVEMY